MSVNIYSYHMSAEEIRTAIENLTDKINKWKTKLTEHYNIPLNEVSAKAKIIEAELDLAIAEAELNKNTVMLNQKVIAKSKLINEARKASTVKELENIIATPTFKVDDLKKYIPNVSGNDNPFDSGMKANSGAVKVLLAELEVQKTKIKTLQDTKAEVATHKAAFIKQTKDDAKLYYDVAGNIAVQFPLAGAVDLQVAKKDAGPVFLFEIFRYLMADKGAYDTFISPGGNLETKSTLFDEYDTYLDAKIAPEEAKKKEIEDKIKALGHTLGGSNRDSNHQQGGMKNNYIHRSYVMRKQMGGMTLMELRTSVINQLTKAIIVTKMMLFIDLLEEKLEILNNELASQRSDPSSSPSPNTPSNDSYYDNLATIVATRLNRKNYHIQRIEELLKYYQFDNATILSILLAPNASEIRKLMETENKYNHSLLANISFLKRSAIALNLYVNYGVDMNLLSMGVLPLENIL